MKKTTEPVFIKSDEKMARATEETIRFW